MWERGRTETEDLVSAVTGDHSEWSAEQNLNIHPWRPCTSIAEIEANHFIECHATAATDLPEPRDSGFGF